MTIEKWQKTQRCRQVQTDPNFQSRETKDKLIKLVGNYYPFISIRGYAKNVKLYILREHSVGILDSEVFSPREMKVN